MSSSFQDGGSILSTDHGLGMRWSVSDTSLSWVDVNDTLFVSVSADDGLLLMDNSCRTSSMCFLMDNDECPSLDGWLLTPVSLVPCDVK